MLYIRSFIAVIIFFFSCSQTSAEEKEIKCLAKNIYYEARSEPHLGQVAVAHVTRSRVLTKKYPDSYCEVVWDEKQFSWTHDGKPDNPYELEKFEKIYSFSKEFFKGNMPPDPTNGALHYHANYADPFWASTGVLTVQIGKHKFYKDVK